MRRDTMEKQPFQAESKRLLDLMINSIYTHKEVFLRELISNSSDAIDKIYYQALTDDSLTFNQEDYYIRVEADKENRLLKIIDTGIGMTKEELESNLGTIAQSGSLAFKKANEVEDGRDIIGQFGVGFYAAFMVSDVVTVETKALGSNEALKWESEGAEGYTISASDKETVGTEITLKIKDNTEDDSYDEYLDENRLKSIIKNYSDFIRYPIKMDITKMQPDEENEEETVEFTEEETINSMVPIWKKNRSELTDEDYENFYHEKNYGFDKPLTYIHTNVDGMIRYNAILYIPEAMPYDFHTKEFEKGLELYSSGVLIMNKSADLLPDHFGFVKGMVDSEDLSLNISREMLQHDRQLQRIAKNINRKIKSELESMQKNDRDKYNTFYEAFGRQLKFGVYNDYGKYKDDLEDLLMFYSSTEKKLVTLAEYVERMKDDQKYIYFASGESIERIEKLPQTELVADKDYEILYFTEDVDEFAIQMIPTYEEKEFRSVSSGDLGIEDEENEEVEKEEKDSQELFDYMKEVLADKVKDVKASKRLRTHPVCLTTEGEVSIEMEKILQANPENPDIQADKVLEINLDHDVYASLKKAFENDKDKVKLYTNILYNQALLIEGLPVNDPVAFADDICKVMD